MNYWQRPREDFHMLYIQIFWITYVFIYKETNRQNGRCLNLRFTLNSPSFTVWTCGAHLQLSSSSIEWIALVHSSQVQKVIVVSAGISIVQLHWTIQRSSDQCVISCVMLTWSKTSSILSIWGIYCLLAYATSGMKDISGSEIENSLRIYKGSY